MGGMGVLMYPVKKPGTITGILALAPFLGEKALIQEISDAGGLKKWQAPPPAAVINGDTYQRELWRWLKAVTSGAEPGPKLFLGFGSSDSLAPAARLLAAELPPDHVYEKPGKHAWEPWSQMWNQFLDASEFANSCR
jgi:S-formylglutathione hydrolase FrmB